MKIQFTPKDFLPSLRLAFTATAAKNCSPVLSNVKIVARHGCAELQATDVTTNFIKYTNAAAEVNGAVLVPKRIISIIDTLPKNELVTLESTKDGIVFYGENTSRYELLTDDVKDFPKIEDDTIDWTEELEMTVLVDDMLTLVNRTLPCIQKENTRYALGGVCFETSKAGKILEAVATNGHQLSWDTCVYTSSKKQNFITGKNKHVIIPFKAISLLAAVLKEGDARGVKMSQSGNKVRFECGSTVFVLDPLNGTFPTWRKIIDDIEKSTIPKLCAEFNSDALNTALKRIKPMFDKNDPSVIFNFSTDQLTLTVLVKDKAATSASLPIKCNGSGTIEIFPKPLMDVLKHVSGDICWTMNGDNPAMFTAGNNYHYVTMNRQSSEYHVEVEETESKKEKSE